jgi:hypothetical protein
LVVLDPVVGMSTPFGGGIGAAGITCGAISGALPTLTVVQQADFLICDETYGLSSRLVGDFGPVLGSLLRPALVGVDLENADRNAVQQALDNHSAAYLRHTKFSVRRV